MIMMAPGRGPGPRPAASVQHHLDPGPVDQAPKLAAEAKPAGASGPGPGPDAEAGSGAPAPRRHSSSLPELGQGGITAHYAMQPGQCRRDSACQRSQPKVDCGNATVTALRRDRGQIGDSK